MGQDSIHALWVDPLAFDAVENGPPYLPEPSGRTVMASNGDLLGTLSSYLDDAPMWELGALVGVLRAASVVHQSHHWQTYGHSYYGDHLLFDRLYNDSLGFIDSVAERSVGTGGRDLVNPKVQANLVQIMVHFWCHPGRENPRSMVDVSLYVERCVLECLKSAKERLSSQGALSEGTDNLLQGVADKHEEFVYLLQQRVQEGSSYDYR